MSHRRVAVGIGEGLSLRSRPIALPDFIARPAGRTIVDMMLEDFTASADIIHLNLDQISNVAINDQGANAAWHFEEGATDPASHVLIMVEQPLAAHQYAFDIAMKPHGARSKYLINVSGIPSTSATVNLLSGSVMASSGLVSSLVLPLSNGYSFCRIVFDGAVVAFNAFEIWTADDFGNYFNIATEASSGLYTSFARLSHD